MAVGGVVFEVTTLLAVVVQVFPVFKTVSVYAAGELTVGVRVVAPLTIVPPAPAVHKYEKLEPLLEPFPLS